MSIGASLAGILADRIGRLPVLAICLYIQGTMAVATYIVQVEKNSIFIESIEKTPKSNQLETMFSYF